ncbi:MAG TPA: glycosyltransferase family 39 protein [Opitutaceae bacterium]|nr:glycosyltransferase family 39 protein [Opitutaceae bacterium]
MSSMNELPPRVTARPCAVIGAIIALLVLFVGFCVGSGWNTSPTFDEPFFIGAGYSFLKGDVHAQPTGNLVLAEKWVALPLLAMKIEQPTEQEYHVAETQLRNAYWLSLFRSRESMFARLRAARAMNTLLGVALALVVFFWSRRLHGAGAGLISLAFCCLCPVVISNSGLATTDIAVTLFFSLAVWSCWTLLHRISVGTVLWCGLAVGGLMATKLSGVLIVPIAILMLAAKLGLRHPVTVALPGRAAREETPASRQFFLLVSAAMAAALVAYFTLWAAFGFHYSFGMQTPAGSYHWYLFEGQPEGLVSNYVAWCREFRLFPEHFLIDVRLLGLTILHHREFLSGQYSQAGWWYFFPVAWFFKTPISFLIAVLAGLIVVLQACRQRSVKAAADAAAATAINFYEFTPLAVLFAVYLGVTMAGTANIGIRHLLPVYPVLFILAGVLARDQRWGCRSGPVLAGALIVWSAGEVWSVYPQTLAYFNEFAGGPKHGYRILVDSSYEWGQDLPAVEKWIARRAGQPGPKPPVYFSYFGSGVLSVFKLDEVVMLPSWFDQPRSFKLTLKPGTYIISATMLESVYNHVAFGPWRDSYESEYQNLASVIAQIGQSHDSAAFAQLTKTGAIQRYDELRLGRLCAYLRKREPDERITYGVFVYELNQAQLDEALLGPPAEL